ncbi:MAG: hypothetical protein ACRDK0_07235 [Solirubrobacteraceae bacterium]
MLLGDTGVLYGLASDGSWFAVDGDGDFAAVDEFGNAVWGDAEAASSHLIPLATATRQFSTQVMALRGLTQLATEADGACQVV